MIRKYLFRQLRRQTRSIYTGNRAKFSETKEFLQKFKSGSVDLVKKDNGIAQIILNNPDRRNALSGQKEMPSPKKYKFRTICQSNLEMFYLNSTLNFGILPVLVFQMEVYYKVDRLLTGLTAQQKGTTALEGTTALDFVYYTTLFI